MQLKTVFLLLKVLLLDSMGIVKLCLDDVNFSF